MRFVGVSGVFALASAGLAMASTEPVAPVKEETAVLVAVAELDAAVIDKKVAYAGAVTQSTAGCAPTRACRSAPRPLTRTDRRRGRARLHHSSKRPLDAAHGAA